MADKHKAIKALKADAKFILIGTDVTWLDGNPTNITEDQINTKATELQTAYDAKQYQRDRDKSYAEIKEQLDLLYHDMAADKGDKTGEWFKAVKKVKDDNPKE